MQPSSNSLPLYFVPLFCFFVAVWGFASFVIAVVSGWFALSGRFRWESNPSSPAKSAGPFFYTVYMRFACHYSSVIRVTAAEDALYLSVLILFRIGHPPLRIPWNEIRMRRAKYLWLWPVVLLTLGNEEQIPMRIPERMARNLGILERIPVEA